LTAAKRLASQQITSLILIYHQTPLQKQWKAPETNPE